MEDCQEWLDLFWNGLSSRITTLDGVFSAREWGSDTADSIEGDRRFYLSLSLIPILFQQSTKDIKRLLYKIAAGS